jgi:hypothetical protein
VFLAVSFASSILVSLHADIGCSADKVAETWFQQNNANLPDPMKGYLKNICDDPSILGRDIETPIAQMKISSGDHMPKDIQQIIETGRHKSLTKTALSALYESNVNGGYAIFFGVSSAGA